MSYQALYRKFRPDSFADVKGQDHIVKTLRNQLESGRIGHAYLFCGTRGTGKTTMAKIFAKAVNCENPGEDGPCNECKMCKSIQNQTSMNVVEIDAASNNKVDDIRQVIDEVQYSPSEGKYKVYIVDEVHMLSTSAFNALLKTLEEPPEYVIFILATTEVHKLPQTILSRCQRYDFKRISVDTIMARLQEVLDAEGIQADEKAVRYIAKVADGALRDGMSLLEQCVSFYIGEKLTYNNVLKVLGAVDTGVYGETMNCLAEDDVTGIIKIVDRVVSEGKDLSLFNTELIWYVRNVLLMTSAEDAEQIIDVSEENLAQLKEVAAKFQPEILLRYIRVLSDLTNQLRYATNKRVLLEVAMIKLCRPQMESNYEALIGRLRSLEKRLDSGDFTVNTAAAPAGQPAPEPVKKRELPKAIPEDVKGVASQWNAIVASIEQPAQSFLSTAKLSVAENGHLFIAFSEETSAAYFDDETEKEKLGDAISNKMGKQIEIEIRTFASKIEYDTIPEIRDVFNLSDKVEINYTD